MAWTLVTGGAKRLGADICLTLAQAGYDIVVHYHRSQQEALQVVESCRQLGVKSALIQGDFSTIEETNHFVERYLERFPETENLINNVGNYLIKPTLETSLEEWLELFQTNLHTPFALITRLAHSIKRFQGHIINIGSSGINFIKANTDAAGYRITKMGLWMLTRSLAKELAPQGIKVNMVSPGYLDISVDLPDDLSCLPMRRAAKCQEISRVIVFMLDPKSEYMTGQNIEVAGGVGL